MNRAVLLDLAERVGWTFVQALAGAVTAGGAAATLGTFDWRAAVAGAGVAALVCLLKVLGVNASAAAQAAPPASPDFQPVASSPLPGGTDDGRHAQR